MIDYTKLKQLREETGVSFALCKKALEQTLNNISEAKKVLTQWGAEQIKKKSGRSTSQGLLSSYVHHNKKVASLVELLCETDFVANSEGFVTLGQELALQVASMQPTNIEELLKQSYVRDPSKKIQDLIQDAVLKFGENIKISRVLCWQLGSVS